MTVVNQLARYPFNGHSCVLTLGNFDGVHIGHQKVLLRVKELSNEKHLNSVLLTFQNHPSEVLRPHLVVPRLMNPEYKNKIIESFGIGLIVALPFTPELSNFSPREFISLLRKHIPFSYFVLGDDATFGKNRNGDKEVLMQIAKEENFYLEYLKQVIVEDRVVSSSSIRQFIQQGRLDEAERLLGRPVSYYGKIIHGEGRGHKIGCPTANLSLEGLCVPPYGVYSVLLTTSERRLMGIANLGIAPTVRKDTKPLLEVHLFEQSPVLYHQFAEVSLLQFIRKEKKFETIDLLREQIRKDIDKAKQSLFLTL